MAANSEGLRKILKTQSLEYLGNHRLLDEDERRGCIWRFAEKIPHASPVAKAHFVNEVHSEWERTQPRNS